VGEDGSGDEEGIVEDEDDSVGSRRERRDSIRRMEGIARLEEEAERIRAMADGSDGDSKSSGSSDIHGSRGDEREGEQGEGDEENLWVRKEQEEYAEQLMMFVRGRLGMFTPAQYQPSGSGNAPPTLTIGVSNAGGSGSGAEASKMLLENLQKQFGIGGGQKKGKYSSPQKSLRARRRESRLWNSIGEIEDDLVGRDAGVGEDVERVDDVVKEEQPLPK